LIQHAGLRDIKQKPGKTQNQGIQKKSKRDFSETIYSWQTIFRKLLLMDNENNDFSAS